jgi:hypothetical protein
LCHTHTPTQAVREAIIEYFVSAGAEREQLSAYIGELEAELSHVEAALADLQAQHAPCADQMWAVCAHCSWWWCLLNLLGMGQGLGTQHGMNPPHTAPTAPPPRPPPPCARRPLLCAALRASWRRRA